MGYILSVLCLKKCLGFDNEILISEITNEFSQSQVWSFLIFFENITSRDGN